MGTRKKTNEEFIEEMRIIQPELKVIGEYDGNKKKILVSNKYGECLVLPTNLLKGRKLSIISAVNKTEYWINQAIEVHEDRYDYSLVEYTSCYENAKIICKVHGVFKQSFFKHLSNRGCPECGKEAGHWTKANYIKTADGRECILYKLRCWDEAETFFKIGMTLEDVKKRFTGKKIPYEYEVISETKGSAGFIWDLEKSEHRRHKEYSYLPNIQFNGYTECFEKLIE